MTNFDFLCGQLLFFRKKTHAKHFLQTQPLREVRMRTIKSALLVFN